MGQIALPSSGLIYVDACALIYSVERVEPYCSCLTPLWRALKDRQVSVVTSGISLLEVLVKPFRDGNPVLADQYRKVLLLSEGFSCYALPLPLMEQAAALRAEHNLKTPDAIHAATGLASGCVLFVTNDVIFKRVPGLNVAVLSEVVAP